MNREQASELVKSLFESWGPALVRYAVHVAGSPDLADDVVQEAFMALYRELCQGKHIESPKGWTLSVVRHQLAMHARNRSRHGEELMPQEALDLLPGSDLGPKAAAPQLEDVTELFSVLSRREKEVLLLRMHSLKYREIATELGISRRAVATLLGRALRKLQRAAEASDTGDRTSIHGQRNAPKTLQ